MNSVISEGWICSISHSQTAFEIKHESHRSYHSPIKVKDFGSSQIRITTQATPQNPLSFQTLAKPQFTHKLQ